MVLCLLYVRYGPYLVRKKVAHVHLEGWKHGNKVTIYKAKHGVYAVAVVMVAMARTCTCN